MTPRCTNLFAPDHHDTKSFFLSLTQIHQALNLLLELAFVVTSFFFGF